MKTPALLATFFIAITIIPVFALAAKPAPLSCDIGPVNKTYGKTPWVIYSCNDNKTVVFVSAAESPAMPFVFTYYAKQSGYQLYGEGTGNKQATAAAYSELKQLSEADILRLIENTRRVKKQGTKFGSTNSP